MDIFRVSVRSITDITPHMRRFTLTGNSLERYGDPGYDERIKVIFGLDPSHDPQRCRHVHDTHLARARWMTEQGYRELTRPPH